MLWKAASISHNVFKDGTHNQPAYEEDTRHPPDALQRWRGDEGNDTDDGSYLIQFATKQERGHINHQPSHHECPAMCEVGDAQSDKNDGVRCPVIRTSHHDDADYSLANNTHFRTAGQCKNTP